MKNEIDVIMNSDYYLALEHDIETLNDLSKGFRQFQNGAEFKTQIMRDWAFDNFKPTKDDKIEELEDALNEKTRVIEEIKDYYRSLQQATDISDVKFILEGMRSALL